MEKILYADDDVDIQESITSILERAGYKATIAKDGLEALSTAKTMQPDLIVLDYSMPGMTGLEVCKALKQDSLTKTIPVIVVTAYPSEKEDSLRAGAVDFIAKPVDKVDLLQRIKSVLKVRYIENELQKVIAYIAELDKHGN